jgi:hypothetical protein
MRDELQFFVRDNYSTDKQELLESCFETIDLYDLEEYDTPFINLLMEGDQHDRTELISQFEALVRNTLLYLISIQHVTLNADIDLNSLNEITRALFEIQSYEDKTTVIDLINGLFNNEEKLAELLALVSILTVDDLLVQIGYVDDELFNCLLDIYEENDLQSNIEENKELLDKLKSFKQFIKYDIAIGFRLIEQGSSYKLPFSFYIDKCKKQLDTMSVEDAAKEISVLLLITEETFRSPIVEYSVRSHDIFSDIDKITKINVQLVRIFSEYEKYMSNLKLEENPSAKE